MIRNSLVLLLAATALTAPLAAQEEGEKKAAHHEAAKAEVEAAWARAPLDETEVRHRDSVTIGGRAYPMSRRRAR